ncbi:DUF6265 family protein [soil metagenome]
MKKLVNFLAFSLVSLVGAIGALGQDVKPSLRSVAFMSGCWEMKIPGRKVVISEQWMSPSGDAMLGMNRTLTDGKMSGFEFLRIVLKGDNLYYVAMPSENDTPTSFELKSASKNNVVFENLGHDFPQTITYTINGSKSMTAIVEGLGSERPKRRRIEFPMVRVKCA